MPNFMHRSRIVHRHTPNLLAMCVCKTPAVPAVGEAVGSDTCIRGEEHCIPCTIGRAQTSASTGSVTRSSAASEWVVDELPVHLFLSFLRWLHLALVKFRAKRNPGR